jgi:hypothetical protein
MIAVMPRSLTKPRSVSLVSFCMLPSGVLCVLV